MAYFCYIYNILNSKKNIYMNQDLFRVCWNLFDIINIKICLHLELLRI